MTSPSTQPETEEQKIKAAMSFSERRKLREQLQDERGVNIYGGERCKCEACGDTHWRRREETKGQFMPKDFSAMKPREVEAYLREQVRRTFGDAVENNATIYARRGYYTVGLILPSERTIEFDNFRKADAPKIAKAIRALK